jgi:hypothetical protein
MKLEKKYIYLIAPILILLLVGGYWLLGKRSNLKTASSSVAPTEAAIPTIDGSVKVDLIASVPGKEVLLRIENISMGTERIDYELSYQTAKQGLQGMIGTINLTGEGRYEKKLTLGTCSSGSCVYHQVVGKIKLTLKFTHPDGEKIFEKEYPV